MLPVHPLGQLWKAIGENMGESCVKIDKERLARRMGGDGVPVSFSSVHIWLIDRGFAHRGGVWYCDGEALCHLKPGEVAEVVKTQHVDGMTFVEREKPGSPEAA